MLAAAAGIAQLLAALAGSALYMPALVFPAVVMLEGGYLLFATTGVLRFWLRSRPSPDAQSACPCVSCVVTCYSEGRGVQRTILSLLDQDYQGVIEILPVIDGAVQNRPTLEAARAMQGQVMRYPRRVLRVLPKWLRGGRASSLNAGLALASGEIIMALDGDTSFDRDMVRRAVVRFQEPGVVAMAGTLRVRNASCNLLTRLQALDYALFRQFVRTGLGEYNVINNIPGAHGIFRTEFLRRLGGWDTGTAEDVDIALRIKKHFGRYPWLRVTADPHVISHTDVPQGWRDFLRQRLRWEGDPAYLFLRKHVGGLRPAVMGWRNFLFCLWYGVIFQLLMPPLLLLSLLYLLLFVPGPLVVSTLLVAYGGYLAVVAALFLLHLLLLSERRGTDVALAWLLPVYPVFILLIRCWSALAVAHNLLLRSHLDTTMAPWWVLRKGRF